METTETSADKMNSDPRDDEDRGMPRYFARRTEGSGVTLSEALSRVLQRLKNLNEQRTDLLNNVETLREEAEKEAQKQLEQLSTLKEQVTALREVLEEMHSRRRT